MTTRTRMQAAGHTPGPWTVTPLLTPEKDDDPQGVYIVEPAATKLWTAYLDADPDSKELDAVHAENEANARLIEAAPKLLEACQAILEGINIGEIEGANHLIEILEKAISTATGGQN